jgi:hypothetical protein
MTKLKNKQKIQKPIDIDFHFKYKCPSENCTSVHWLSLKETQTKNFKVVCDCGIIYKPKRISKIQIVYLKKSNKNTNSKLSAPADIKNRCSKLLMSYGFTSGECECLIDTAYNKFPDLNAGSLVKYILQHLGELNECN